MAGATNKYVTVTGNRCEDYEYGDRTQELQVLLDKFMRRPEIGAENAINAKNSDLSMEQLLQLAKSSKNGAAFTALWNSLLEGYFVPIRGRSGAVQSSRLLDRTGCCQDGPIYPASIPTVGT